MSNQWFRLYSEFSVDPKVQMLSEAMQRRLIMLFCSRCNGHVTLQDSEVTFMLRISDAEWAETKAVFVAKGFIDSANNILNWDKRQFRSDSSAARVARHRAKQKQEPVTPCNVTVTPQNRTEQIQNRTEKKEETSKEKGSRFALTDLPGSWRVFCQEKRPELDPDELFEEFGDYWRGVPGKQGRKTDWEATWRNRVRDKKASRAGHPDKAAEIRAHNDRILAEGRAKYANAE